MPALDKLSLKRLETCDIQLQVLIETVAKFFPCMVACGHRGEIEQNKAFTEGYSQKKWPHGNHNALPSKAVDVYPIPVNLHPKNERELFIYKYRMAYFAGQVKAIARCLKADNVMKNDIIWGCDWDDDTEIGDHKLLDFPHFELKL